MDKESAKRLVKNTFNSAFDKERFIRFIKELLNNYDESNFIYRGNLIKDSFEIGRAHV